MHIIEKLEKAGVIHPPSFVATNTIYLCIMGSEAYGVATDLSDKDIYGIVIPPKNYIFPQLDGYIHGFDNLPGHCDIKKQQWCNHHVRPYELNNKLHQYKGKEFDFTVYQIHKFFKLVAEGNPSLIDALFVPRECLIYCNQIGEKIRENRHMFLSKGAWPKYKGYAYGQLDKLKKFDSNGKRAAVIEKYGYDIKNAYHVVRLLNEIEQILVDGDLDLRQNREQLKSIRRGEWSYQQIVNYFETKERELERVKSESKLQEHSDKNAIRALMIECLEIHYGNLERETVSNQDRIVAALQEIGEICQKSKKFLEFT